MFKWLVQILILLSYIVACVPIKSNNPSGGENKSTDRGFEAGNSGGTKSQANFKPNIIFSGIPDKNDFNANTAEEILVLIYEDQSKPESLQLTTKLRVGNTVVKKNVRFSPQNVRFSPQVEEITFKSSNEAVSRKMVAMNSQPALVEGVHHGGLAAPQSPRRSTIDFEIVRIATKKNQYSARWYYEDIVDKKITDVIFDHPFEHSFYMAISKKDKETIDWLYAETAENSSFQRQGFRRDRLKSKAKYLDGDEKFILYKISKP